MLDAVVETLATIRYRGIVRTRDIALTYAFEPGTMSADRHLRSWNAQYGA
jgi:hypothetical protein